MYIKILYYILMVNRCILKTQKCLNVFSMHLNVFIICFIVFVMYFIVFVICFIVFVIYFNVLESIQVNLIIFGCIYRVFQRISNVLAICLWCILMYL
jgi:hypothetical protein